MDMRIQFELFSSSVLQLLFVLLCQLILKWRMPCVSVLNEKKITTRDVLTQIERIFE
jgi:hypothetical protein